MKYLERYYKLNYDQVLDLSDLGHNDVYVVMPCYKEEYRTVEKSVDSILKAMSASDVQLQVLILVNYKDEDDASIKSNSSLLSNALKEAYKQSSVHVFEAELKGKKAGVGMARKLLMDSVFSHQFELNQDALIVNIDADTVVDLNYIEALKSYFDNHTEKEAAGIYYEHSLEGIDNYNRDAIMSYELHLRYFIDIQKHLCLPFGFQTVGSAMVCRAWAYAKYGGMPLRQAGEDFYFMHKFSKVGRLGEINSTTVRPSARTSDRVPFGTGRAMLEMLQKGSVNGSYSPKSFWLLKKWLKLVFDAYDSGSLNHVRAENECMNVFLETQNAIQNIADIRSNTTNKESFAKRFFQWFDAFKLMKYLHHMRQEYPDQDIRYCLEQLCQALGLVYNKNAELYDWLLLMRAYDKSVS